MAGSTSDRTRTNVDYRKSKLIRTNRTVSKQTHKHITRLTELAVDDELAVDEVVHVEVSDDAQQTQATVGGSPFGPFIPVARGHSRE